MKLLHYFLGFNSAVLAYFLFIQVLSITSTQSKPWVFSCILFSILSSTAIYNLVQGYKLHKEEY